MNKSIKKNALVYCTWGDRYSGIYKSQVIDVCKFINEVLGYEIKLVAFVPYTLYKKQKKQIKSSYGNSVCIPMIPSRNHWWPFFTFFLLPFFPLIFNKDFICRGSIATNVALLLKRVKFVNRVIYDGRGAQKAEWKEYLAKANNNSKMVPYYFNWERNAVRRSDFRMAVSSKLVEFWRNEYGYTLDKHVVIPCTLNAHFNREILLPNQIAKKRKQYGFDTDDIILIYSGSANGWQSFSKLDDLLYNLLSKKNKFKIFMLTKVDLNQLKTYKEYPDNFRQAWVSPSELFDLLSIGDYGILYREDTITNRVAAPTKFAEYLAAGLKVLISENIGDYSHFVRVNDAGYVLNTDVIDLEQVCYDEKKTMNLLARKKLVKNNFINEYKFMLSGKLE